MFRQHLIKFLTTRYDKTTAVIFNLEQDLSFKRTRTSFAFKIFRLRISQTILEFLIIIIADPSLSFKILKKRDEFAVSKVSYVEYRLYSKKLKLLSLGGISTVMFATLMVSFIVNFVMPNLNTLAATYAWVQTNWNGGADGGAYPVDPENRTNWTKYSSIDSLIDTSTAGTVTINSSANTFDTSDTDFNATATFSFAQISGSGNGASVRLLVPE